MDMLAKAGIAGRIASVTHFIYKTFISGPKEANEAYLRLFPVIRLAVKEYGRESKEVQDLLNMLGELAPAGAKRRNFLRKYITPLGGWNLLPPNPDEIPYGYWH